MADNTCPHGQQEPCVECLRADLALADAASLFTDNDDQPCLSQSDDGTLTYEYLAEADVAFIDAARTRWPAAVRQLLDVMAERDRLREELDMWRPLTSEEAQRAYDEAEAVPMSQEEIDRIVERATDPAERVSNSEQAQMVGSIRRLTAERDALDAEVHQWRRMAAEQVADDMQADSDLFRAYREVQAERDRLRAELLAKPIPIQMTLLVNDADAIAADVLEQIAAAVMAERDNLRADLDDARSILSSLSSWLGNGQGDDTTTAQEYNRRILDGVATLLRVETERREKAEAERDALRAEVARLNTVLKVHRQILDQIEVWQQEQADKGKLGILSSQAVPMILAERDRARTACLRAAALAKLTDEETYQILMDAVRDQP